MIAFVISVNGERTHTIGVGDNGVLCTHLDWVGRSDKSSDLIFQLTGLDCRTDEHLYWPPLPNINVGDTLSRASFTTRP